jgi:hypothetical protein
MDKCMDKGTKRVAAGFAGFAIEGNRVWEFAGFAGFAEPGVEKCRVLEFVGFVVFAGFAAVAGFPIQTLCADDTGAPHKNILCTSLR